MRKEQEAIKRLMRAIDNLNRAVFLKDLTDREIERLERLAASLEGIAEKVRTTI